MADLFGPSTGGEWSRLLFAASLDAVLVIDDKSNILFANPAVRDVFGYAPEQLTGKPLFMLQPERLREAHRRAMARYMTTGEQRLDWRAMRTFALHRDGREFPVEIAFTGLSPRRFGGFIRDISERVNAERALEASEARYRELVDNANDIVYTHDLQGAFTYVNAAGVRTYGWSAEELSSMSINDIVDPDHLELARAKTLEKIFGDSDVTLPYPILTRSRDGREIWVEVNTRIVRNNEGAPVAVQGIARDVTARHQAEEALARTQDFRDLVLESTSNAIAVFDMDGRMTMVNRRLCEMTGYSQEEMVGQRFTDLFDPRVEPAATKGLRAVLEGEVIDSLEFEAVRKDGVAFIARATLRPLLDGGRIIGAIGTADDVTVHRRNDALLASQRQLMEMIAVGATLEEVLNQISTTVERQAPPGRCSILLLDQDGVHLRPGAAPSMPESFVAATDGLEIGPRVGTCGTAAWRGESVVSEDVASDPLFDGVHEVMASYGIAASWSVPILSGAGDVLGTFAMYHAERHVPTPHEEQTIAVFSHVAGIAIERTRAARKAAEQTRLLAEKSSQLEDALDAERERARRDPLTGALNHAVIADEVRRLIDDASVRSFALAMVDVDGLKAVNDTYGHQIGDEVLLAVAASLKTDGAIVGRYGGDEFVAILLDVDRGAAARYRERVTEALDAVELRDPDTGSRIHIDASIGLAIYPEEGDAVEDLIKLSDSAMYASRRQRADLSASAAFARIHGGDRAAEIVGEIVPFLTSPGNLQEKLNLVAGRVNAGAGYDGVNFTLYGNAGPGARSASFSPDSNDAADEYSQTSMPKEEPGPLRILLEATRRPVIIDDISTSEFTTPEQRKILGSVGIRSGLVVPMVWRGTLVGAISVGSKREAAFGPRDAQFLTAIATQVTAIVRTAALVDDLQSASDRLLQAQTETVLMLAAAAEAHDDTTGRHLKRVRGIAQAIAIELGYNEAKAKEIGLAAVLHDIGKIRVPDYVLASSASLSDQEWALMKEHTVWGSEFLGSRGGFELAMQVARSHHERWDGSGYPDGLAGDHIPEAAAITSVADSLDAMISDRPYRPGRPLDDAIHEIEAWSGRQFSPNVVEALLAIYRRGALGYLTTDDIPQDLAA